MSIQRKFFPSAAEVDPSHERQVRAVITTTSVDRMGDVVVADGLDLAAYRANPVILFNHDPACPIARCVEIKSVDGGLEATAQFPPAGTDPLADRVYGLIKAGVINATSIGFNPLQAEPLKGGGMKFLAAELMEFSFVAVPANAGALIVERSAAPAPTASVVKDGGALASRVKSLYDVAYLAELLSSLGYVESNAEWEADWEGDGSPVPGMLAAAMRQLGGALVAMTTEEVAELLSKVGGQESGCCCPNCQAPCVTPFCPQCGTECSAATAATPQEKAAAQMRSFRSIIKAGRVLSAANEADIKAAVELIGGASEALSGVLRQVEASDDAGAAEQAKDARARRAKALSYALI